MDTAATTNGNAKGSKLWDFDTVVIGAGVKGLYQLYICSWSLAAA